MFDIERDGPCAARVQVDSRVRLEAAVNKDSHKGDCTTTSVSQGKVNCLYEPPKSALLPLVPKCCFSH